MLLVTGACRPLPSVAKISSYLDKTALSNSGQLKDRLAYLIDTREYYPWTSG